jgi:hypothetical protein
MARVDGRRMHAGARAPLRPSARPLREESFSALPLLDPVPNRHCEGSERPDDRNKEDGDDPERRYFSTA